MLGQVSGPQEDAPRDAAGTPGAAAVAATAIVTASAEDPLATAAGTAVTTGPGN
jgi:hypothetical protein